MRTTRLPRLLLVPIAGLFLLACGGEDPQGPDDGSGNGAEPSISLSLGTDALTVTQGESGQVTATVSRSGGFSGEVTLAASGLPDGVSVPSVTVPGGSTEGTLTVEASSSAATGTSSVTAKPAAPA